MAKDNWHEQGFASEWDESGNVYTNPDRLNQLSLLASLLAMKKPARLLDLGVGSAQVEIAIQQQFPDLLKNCEITGIDGSSAMLELAKYNLERANLNQIKLVNLDFSDLNTFSFEYSLDAVICVQALHEVQHDIKKSLFEWVHNQLSDQGRFYIFDRFIYTSGIWKEDWRSLWQWLQSDVDVPVMEFDEYESVYDAKTDHIAQVSDYVRWLNQTGFECICPYQCFNRALLVARKV